MENRKARSSRGSFEGLQCWEKAGESLRRRRPRSPRGDGAHERTACSTDAHPLIASSSGPRWEPPALVVTLCVKGRMKKMRLHSEFLRTNVT